MAKNTVFIAAIFLNLLASSPALGQAASYNISGSGISGSLNLTTVPSPNTGVWPGASPNLGDPPGSFAVSDITGSFSDAKLGLLNVAITGVVPSNPGSPTPDNLLAPHSFGFYPVTNGVPGPDGTAPGFSYDNLYYPAGSPQTATSYPGQGGIFDIYGVVFTLAGGDSVNLWSYGDMGGGVTYGAGVTDGKDLLDYAQPVSVAAVPEPSTWAMMLVGLGAVGVGLRRRKTNVRVQFANA